ncbi:MAG: hypothetical protein AAGD01_16580 [Acidobacteriota bacterium]
MIKLPPFPKDPRRRANARHPFQLLLPIAAAVVALLWTPLPSEAQEQSTLLLAFKNREGRTVSGLLMDIDSPSGCVVEIADSGPFPLWAGDRRTLRLYNGRLGSGRSLRVQVVHNCVQAPTVQEWWWIDSDGDRIGVKKKVPQDAEDKVSVISVFEEGVGTYGLAFTLPSGSVELTLPQDLVAGERISGRVAYQVASGGDVDDNRQAIARVAVEVAGRSLAPGSGRWSLELPEDGSSGIVEVTLWDARGMLLAANAAPLAAQLEAPSDAFLLPRLSQAGQPFRILGPFDGNSDNTQINLGGNSALVLAETLRGLVVQAPNAPIGGADLEIREADIVAAGDLRNVSIDVRSTKSTIDVGERLQLSIAIAGLEGLQQAFDVHVLNRTVGLAHFLEMERAFDLTISPEVVVDGAYAHPITLEGSRGGSFEIQAELGGLR